MNKKNSNNSGNPGSRQGGGTPNAVSMSTPSRPPVRGGVTNSEPRSRRLNIPQNFQEQLRNLSITQVQERQGGGALQSQLVETQQQDQEEEYFDEQDDRGQEVEDTQLR